MRTKTMILAGIIAVLALSVAGGCKKKDGSQAQKSPAASKVPPFTFSSIIPATLPNVPAAPGGVGKVELINDAKAVDKTAAKVKGRLSLAGWAVNTTDGTTPPIVVIQLSTSSGISFYTQASRTDQKRPDIAKELKNPAFEQAAFQLNADISAVPPGTYLISMLLSNGKYIVGFDTTNSLVIQ